MTLTAKTIGVLSLLLICGYVFADEGECDPSVPRIKKTLLYQSGEESVQGDITVVTPVCTDQVVKVKSCAVISDLKVHLQEPCMDLIPQRLDFYDKIEYYERANE
jgi:hypothetical protein